MSSPMLQLITIEKLVIGNIFDQFLRENSGIGSLEVYESYECRQFLRDMCAKMHLPTSASENYQLVYQGSEREQLQPVG